MFFSEVKNQKTFIPCAGEAMVALAGEAKACTKNKSLPVFAEKNAFFLSPYIMMICMRYREMAESLGAHLTFPAGLHYWYV